MNTLLALTGNSPLEDWHLVHPRDIPVFAWVKGSDRRELFLSVKVKKDSSMCWLLFSNKSSRHP